MIFAIFHSCLAHVVNLATQALIGAYSKSPHFDPKSPDSHIPTCRDEVGLIRAIVVKVRCIIYELLNRVDLSLGVFFFKAERDVEDGPIKGKSRQPDPTCS